MAATFDDELAELRRINAELRQKLNDYTAERDEALEQQTATAEILRVISGSPTDLQPTFDAIAANAMVLSGSEGGGVFRFDGSLIHFVAHYGWSLDLLGAVQHEYPIAPGRHSTTARAILTREVAHIPDAAADPEYALPAILQTGVHTMLSVPILQDGNPVGAITVTRREVAPFSEAQINLLKTFADQAVIAIENVRLFNETREALEQQTATAEVLEVINSSRGDLGPVFAAILEKARRLCETAFGILWTYDGERFHAASFSDPLAAGKAISLQSQAPEPGGVFARHVAGEDRIYIPDLDADRQLYLAHARRRFVVDELGLRTHLSVAMRKDGVLLGVISVYRREVRPFADKQITLLENFGAQAVVAIESARLLSELRARTRDLEESLEYQTATSDVLQVISRSTFDLQPVLQTVVAAAHRLCRSDYSVIFRKEGEEYRWAAGHGLSAEYEVRERRAVIRPGPATVIGRAVAAGHAVQIADAQIDPLYEGEAESDARAMLGVPLLRDGVAIGGFGLARNRVEAFSDREVELVTTFADQAVIAIENARLLTETREALEQQTATAEVLQVINSSPGDLTPVFDAMLDKAMRLCEAAFGFLSTYDGEYFHAVALRGVPQKFAEGWLSAPYRPGPNTTHDRLIRGERIVHVPDLAADGVDDPRRRAVLEVAGIRSVLGVPLRKEGALLGAIHIYRQEVRPFIDKQIVLAENFAAQAVIAMENARLLDEIRQRQQELRVTFDNMVDGVAMFDETLHLAAWNRNFQQLLDLPSEFLADRHGFDDYIRHLTLRGEFGETDPETEIRRLRARIDDHYTFERTRPDGTVIEVRHNPMPGGGLILIYSDITERKRSEAEISAARDAAEAAYRDLKAAQVSLIQAEKMASLGQLTAGIAHEIKNPLNFVNNFADLSVGLLDELKETAAPAIASLGDEQRAEVDDVIELLTGNLDKIAEHGRRADGIVKSMLEHSRGTTGERRTVDLNSLVGEALNLAYHGARAQDASFNITLEPDFADAIPPIELVPQDITRVCLNLISNGFYAATKRKRQGDDPQFEPTLKVTTRDLGDAVEIGVRDNGTGIPPEVRDKLFQPFFTTKPTGEGTGLGLSISYDIVTQQHGGTIEVDSRVNEFTEFRVRLPHPPRTTLAQAAS
jgi:two-component system, NtrC family, sensor kinase